MIDDREILTMLTIHKTPDRLAEEVIQNYPKEFGRHLLIYHRVNIETATVAMRELMLPEDMEEYRRGLKRSWTAECHCTACENDWLSAWTDGGRVGILQGEDGENYPGIADEEGAFCVLFDYGEGDMVTCPYCGESIRATRCSSLRHGHTQQLMAYNLVGLGKYTALIYYLVYRRMGADGIEDQGAAPIYATVIDERGRLVRYCRSVQKYRGKQDATGPWRRCKTNRAPDTVRYHSAESINQTKVGASLARRNMESQDGLTGEKTGLYEYLDQGGEHPEAYLRFWRKNPNIENLVKSGGWVEVLNDALGDDWTAAVQGYGRAAGEALENLAEWALAKPNEMLYMEKPEFRRVSGKWDRKTLEFWMWLIRCGCAGPGDVGEVEAYIDRYGLDDVQAFMGDVLSGEVEYGIETVDKYLRRQNRKYGVPLVGLLRTWCDYISIASADGLIALAPREVWPDNLIAEHNAVMRQKNRKASKAAFKAVYQRWKALEWSDGEICVRLPRCNKDLVDEHNALHHCVDGYGPDHVGGKLVLFVRHARRPERSWYTLNVDVRGPNWHRIQLHGYRNDYIAVKGLHLHIDKRVLAFLDRWEREVLTPVFRVVSTQNKPKDKIGDKKKRKGKAA